MPDLIVPAGTTLAIDPTYAVAPNYGLFQMGDNARIRLTTDFVLKADRAEFGANCGIDARGQDGATGAPGMNGAPGQSGGNGMPGGAGGDGHGVTIQAGLAQVGRLTIDAGGGAGGAGGVGGMGAGSGAILVARGHNGGSGGNGGAGGNAGQISLAWTGGLVGHSGGSIPPGHTYSSAGGAGGPAGQGGEGGPSAEGIDGDPGLPGAPGATGKSSIPQVVWRADLDALLWAQAQDIGPPARFGHRLAFDPKRGKLVLFGGLTDAGAHLGDTWEWDGQFWTQVADTGPAGRAWHGMAFDPSSGTTLVFGGRSSEPNDQTPQAGVLADTWSWDGATWIQVADTGPSARSTAVMAADPVRNRVALFGGGIVAGGAAPDSDTWEWDGTTWNQLADSGPAGRLCADMAFDAGAGLLTLFGGLSAQGTDLGDTWTWNGKLWTQVADTGPAARDSHAMASFGGAIILYGGMTLIQGGAGGATSYGDTWAWEVGAWRQIQDMGPGVRNSHAMATVTDAAGDHVTLVGGQAAAALQDTWRLIERF